MAAGYAPEKVMNGTFAQCWINDYFLAEGTEMEAKISLEKKEVKQAGTLAKGYKIVGTEGKGKIKINKISSFFIDLIADNLKAGKTTVCTMISNVQDPDSGGESERVKLTGVTFDELTLVSWKTKELIEDEYSFTFSGFEVLDTVTAN